MYYNVTFTFSISNNAIDRLNTGKTAISSSTAGLSYEDSKLPLNKLTRPHHSYHHEIQTVSKSCFCIILTTI